MRLPRAAGPLLALLLGLGLGALLRLRPWDRRVQPAADTRAREADQLLLLSALLHAPAPAAEGPDVLLVVLDTTRADALELYGGPAPTMPRLAAWARRARVYTRAQAESSWTLASHASLFTGLRPSEHGATGRLLTARERRLREQGRLARRHPRLESPLPGRAVTLAERLSRAGWLTLGIAANRAYLRSDWGLDQGFDAWLCEQLPVARDGLPYTRADRVVALARTALDYAAHAGADGRRAPLFLFLNFMDAHLPYVPRRGYVDEPLALLAPAWSGRARQRLVDRVLAGRAALPARVRRAWWTAYRAELRYLDEQLGGLLAELEASGFFAHGYAVITADHGEYFGEHGLVEHSKDLYQEALHVPLLLRGPGIEPGRDETPVQLGDVARWIVRWTGVELLPAPVEDGGLLISELYGSRLRDVSNPSYGARFDRLQRAFRLGDRVLLLGSDGSAEAYELDADPGELHDRWGEPWSLALRRRAEAWIARLGPRTRGSGEVDGETWEALRALGYAD